MSLNATAVPLDDAWNGFLASAQAHLPQDSFRLTLLALVNVPVIAIVLNVLWQLVGTKDASAPPVVFHLIPFFGSAAGYGDNPLKFFFECKKKYGDVFTFVMLGRKITVALGPNGNNFVLGGKSRSFSAEEAYTHLTTPVFGKDVVYDVPNEKFMEQKKFVKVGLTIDNLRAYVGLIEDEVEHFMDHDQNWAQWQQNDVNEWGTLDIDITMSQTTILTAARTLQGTEVRNGLDKSFAQLYTDLDGGFTPLHWMFPGLPLPSYRRRDAAQAKMTQFYLDIMHKRKEGETEQLNDMIAALMNQKYRDGTGIKEHEVAHMMIALLMAGQHTSAATSSWAMLHIANDATIAEALYQEQVKHFRSPNGSWRSMTYEELRELPVLDSVIRETLRIHPPLHSIMRMVKEPVAVPPTLANPGNGGTYVVPKGNFVLASPLVSQMDPAVWREPTKWEPTRWSDPEGVAAQAYKQYSDESGEKVDFGFGAVSKGTVSPYQPFGAGRHRCIGEQFAYLQLGTILATIVRRVELRIHGQFPSHNYHTMITMPTRPCKVAYRRRQHD